jgi:hypothetical protein
MAGIITGNVQSLSVVSATLSPVIVAANTTAEQTFTVPGVLASDMLVEVNKPTAQAGLGIAGVRVSAANTIAITFSNNTAAGITPTASEVYLLLLARKDSAPTGFNV